MTSDPVTSAAAIEEQDTQYLRLLSIFHYVAAALFALFGSIFLVHVAMGIGMLSDSGMFGKESPPPPFIGWVFTVMGSLALLLGWSFAVLLVVAGKSLARNRRYTFCLVIAAIACVFMPVGTVLGVFTIIVLLRPSVRRRFGVPVPAAAAG